MRNGTFPPQAKQPGKGERRAPHTAYILKRVPQATICSKNTTSRGLSPLLANNGYENGFEVRHYTANAGTVFTHWLSPATLGGNSGRD